MKANILDNIDLDSIQAERCRRNFYTFFLEFWDVIVPEELQDNWHIKYLCDELQKVGERIIRREPKEYDLIINISPGSTKSTIATVMFPAWLWANDASLRTIAGSHAAGLSTDLAVKSRDIIRSDKYKKYFGVELKEDDDTKTKFGTPQGGKRVSTSVGSSAIGQHAHVIIVDDPLPVNPTEKEIKTANNWVTNELATRKIDKQNTPTILIMQRLAENDPTAHMLAKSNSVKHICLPAELTDDVQPEQLKENYVNGLMDINRLNIEVLQDMKARLGSFGYASQFLQTPQPVEGGIIKGDWINIVNPSDELKAELADTTPHFFLDTAYTDDAGNDPTAILVAKQIGNLMYVINATEVWKEFPDLVNWLPSYLNKYGYNNKSKVFVEPKASGKSVVQYLQKQTKYNVIEDKPPRESKDTRLKAIAPKVEAKKVYLLQGEWNDNFIQQLTHAKPAHDDMRDTFVMAVRKLLVEKVNSRIAWR